jgi:ATP-dependent Clp protease ATP-binding subunit ClpA
MFLPLTPDQLAQILELMLKKEVQMLAAQGVTLELSGATKVWMLAQNDHPEWGARPLRRIIQKNLREPLADWLLNTAPPKGAKVAVDAGEKGLTFAMS